MKQLLRDHHPKEDVAVLRTFKKKYGSPCDVVAKDKCFYFAHNEGVDDEGEKTETKSHFDFGLFGNLNGSEYGSDEGKKFAVAYFREDLKAMDLNPDIFAQQNDNKDKSTQNKAYGRMYESTWAYTNYHNNENTGMAKTFDDQYYLDVIGTSYCRSRAIACTQDEYKQFETWRIAKGQVVSTHQTWV